MRMRSLSIAVTFCLASSGCRLTQNVVRTTLVEPLQYSRDAYEKIAHKHFIELAEGALAQSISLRRAELDNYNCEPFSDDYQAGFIDGYVDYLEGGGTGQPPLLPPRRYWNASYQTFAGHLAAEHWFEGYRHGAECARASSYRSLVTIPLSDEIVSDTRPYTYGRIVADDRVVDTNKSERIELPPDHDRTANAGDTRGAEQPQPNETGDGPKLRRLESDFPMRPALLPSRVTNAYR